MKSYHYNPANISENGVDRMRFELGDTMTESAETCALSDEEYDAVLALYPSNWKRAKLACLQSIVHRFLYEVDTEVGPLSLALHQRAETWKNLYEEMKAEVMMTAVPRVHPQAIRSQHYFYEGMHDNPNAGGENVS